MEGIGKAIAKTFLHVAAALLLIGIAIGSFITWLLC